MTKYVVLSRNAEGRAYTYIGEAEASSTGQAIRNTIGQRTAGIFVAVPKGSFKPQRVEVVTPKPRIALSGVTEPVSEPPAE